jgi:hypothetical protein
MAVRVLSRRSPLVAFSTRPFLFFHATFARRKDSRVQEIFGLDHKPVRNNKPQPSAYDFAFNRVRYFALGADRL